MLIGLVGKPSCGKSTFFQAITDIPVARANYPFTTIEPNHGVAYIRIECVDKEFNTQCNPRTGFCIEHNRFVPVEVMDVAGLVPGAHEGKGLGNQFLDDLRQADLLIHVVDASGSTNEKGEPVPRGSYDPVKDVEFLEEEINLWFKGILGKNWNKLVREHRSKNSKIEDTLSQLLSGLGIDKTAVIKSLKQLNLNEKNLEQWTDEDRYQFAKKARTHGKPIIIAANKCDLPGALENVKRMREAYPDEIIISCSAEAEIALKEASKKGFIKYIPGDNEFKVLKELTPQQKKALDFVAEFMKEKGTGVQKIINTAVLDVLEYIAIFPGGVNKLADDKGNVLPDVFLLKKGSTALDFAGAIHTDFAKNFIKAIDVRTKRALGADYVLKHRNVLEIAFKK
ncbi:redox-regulated ATPase YchF [Candidatus Micrarchaeota archaeon]|nr:redox-regulated ATPase YchF [Candidatus Micrarchaeota archaeon]